MAIKKAAKPAKKARAVKTTKATKAAKITKPAKATRTAKAVKTVRTAKKAVAAKTAMKRGSKYACGVCGLAVTVDQTCGCVEAAHLICCGEPMKAKKK